MFVVVLRTFSSLMGGAVVGIFLAQAFNRTDYLNGRDGSWGGLSLFLVIMCVFLLAATVFGLHVNHMAVSPELGQHRSVVMMYGAVAVGMSLGLVLITMLMTMLVDVGTTRYPYDNPLPWTSQQWAAYYAPYVAGAILFVIGAIAVGVGVHWLRPVRDFLTEVASRSRGGKQFPGRIVAAEASPDGTMTRVAAEFSAPDGVRRILAVVHGAEREWLLGARSTVWIDPRHPYEPRRISFNARTFWRGQVFLATEAPPASPAVAAGLR